jgi:putative sterol carrier protein
VAPVAATRLTEDVLPPDLFERLKPEFVAPMVLYLSSEACSETGMIFNAGMGCYNRAAVVTGPGAVVGDGQTPPTPEQIQQNWDAINNLEGHAESSSATQALVSMLEAFTPKTSESPKATGVITVKTVFDRMPDAFRSEKAAGVDVVFQYRITGADGGEWFVTIKGATCKVEQGSHAKPTTTIIMSDEDFLALISGKLNAMQAFTSGKLKVEGDLMKSQLIEKLFKF